MKKQVDLFTRANSTRACTARNLIEQNNARASLSQFDRVDLVGRAKVFIWKHICLYVTTQLNV